MILLFPNHQSKRFRFLGGVHKASLRGVGHHVLPCSSFFSVQVCHTCLVQGIGSVRSATSGTCPAPSSATLAELSAQVQTLRRLRRPECQEGQTFRRLATGDVAAAAELFVDMNGIAIVELIRVMQGP